MRLEAKKYLYDINEAVARIEKFTSGQTLETYAANAMLRSAVERQFEIVGEALAQLVRKDEQLVARISEYRRIVALRNVLSHGYATVDDRLVWDIVQTKLPALREEINRLLAEN